MKIRYCIIVFALLATCNSPDKNNTLKIATAANLRFAMEEINRAFENQSGIKVEMITASSGKLTAQIKNGAPYHVFLSANYKYPETLFKEGFTKDIPILFCKGTLVVWTNKNRVIDSSLIFLKNADIEKIVIANPQNAPYGIAAGELLKNIGLYEVVKSKLIYAENVSQLNQYVINKACDIGITSKSAVLAPKLKGVGNWKELDTIYYKPVEQYVVGLKANDNQSENAKKYIEFILGEKAEVILKDFGYEIN